MLRRITCTALPDIPLVEPGDPLADLILGGLARAEITLQTGDILVVAQKIVSKSEGRLVDLATFEAGPRALDLAATARKDPRLVEAILAESTEVVRVGPGVIVVEHKLGFVMANAGIDQSNIQHPDGREMILLLPDDPDGSAARLKAELDRRASTAVGVVVNDSFGRPWRNGVVGVALGAAGLCPLVSLVGSPDLFGRTLRVTEIAVADELSAAASLLMGQAAEGCPVIHVRGWEGRGPDASAAALIRPKSSDMFR
ncbi:coenzyme F420-0:L-glutamate ligase [Methylobacterium sp. NEAU 140]|uniref:coenzyme F420-0:L-glutamate ligase n=1 Tax=Methylobacterium sp. NEAU 140 TaxID=3064945 RepID=UPI0027340369|nr:coenzyme F420-0:L-glutamate ligase [Methylobacterium sp. NEAU 140]MDP4026596.1 coenzyme F420-0:L-glutamate ligase [Methylobacterium sp. NEAU 140]